MVQDVNEYAPVWTTVGEDDDEDDDEETQRNASLSISVDEGQILDPVNLSWHFCSTLNKQLPKARVAKCAPNIVWFP